MNNTVPVPVDVPSERGDSADTEPKGTIMSVPAVRLH